MSIIDPQESALHGESPNSPAFASRPVEQCELTELLTRGAISPILNVMVTTEKRIRQLFEHPKNIRFKELDGVMTNLGYQKRQSGTGGSHYVYSHPNVDALVVLVSHGRNDVLPDYQVKKAFKSIEQLLGEE